MPLHEKIDTVKQMLDAFSSDSIDLLVACNLDLLSYPQKRVLRDKTDN